MKRSNKQHTNRRRNAQRGFSMAELMVALTVLLVGISGVLSLQMVGLRASSYSRHSTEATVLGEDKMEALRTVEIDTLLPGTEKVNAQGLLDATGPYDRSWNVNWVGTVGVVTVTVSWLERGTDVHSVVLRTQRNL